MSKLLTKPQWRHPGFALMLPALLLALGAWQVTRITGEPGAYEGRAARIEAAIDRLKPRLATDPMATIRFQGDSRTYTVSTAVQLMQDAVVRLRRDGLVEQARVAAAWVTVAGGAAAVLAAIVGLVAVWSGARRGMRSRDALVAGFSRVVRVLPPVLGCLAVSTAVAVVGAVLFEIGGGWFIEGFDAGEVKLLFAGVVMAGAAIAYAVSAVRQLRRSLAGYTTQPMQVLGRAVNPAEAPGLWTLLRDVATRQGATPPDNLVLGLTKGFFVTSAQVLLDPEQRSLNGRTLYMPAPVLALLSPGEVTVIVAHELAHFTGDDTRYSQYFLPLYNGMIRSVEAVSARNTTRSGLDRLFLPAGILARHVLDRFDRVVSHWSRVRELEADHSAVDLGVARHAATALIRNGIATELLGGTLEDIYSHPGRSSPDVVGAVLARAAALGFAEPGRHLEDRQSHPTDSHPPTRARIEALGVPIDTALLTEASRPVCPEDEAVVSAWFTDWAGLRAVLGEDLLAVARVRDSALQSALEEAAAAISTADVPVYEATMTSLVATNLLGWPALGGGLLLGWVTWTGHYLRGGEAQLFWAAAGLLVAIGAGFLLLGVVRYRRAKAGPFLLVGPLGFQCTGVAGLVPWSSVTGIGVTVGRAFLTRFGLAADAPWPEQAGHRWSVKLDRKRRVLTLKGFVPKGMKPQAYLDLLNRTLRAHRAAEALRARGATPPGRVSAASAPVPSA